MNKILWFVLIVGTLLIYLSLANAQERPAYVRPNPVLPQADVIRQQNGSRAGYVKPNAMLPGQYDVYDSHGNRTGYIRKNPVLNEQYDVIDEDND